jgi:catechol-2,3-dioxygenase
VGETRKPPRLGHVALTASHPRRLATFYQDLLDLQIVRQTSNSQTGTAVLLSGDPQLEDHELVFLTNPGARHLAYRVDCVEPLRTIYRRAKRRGLEIPFALDSGVALGFFVRDPEGNALEIYLRTDDPHRDKPPLSDPAEIDRLITGSDELSSG